MCKATQDCAVLLLAYGAPTDLTDVPAFLINVRRGRPLSPALIRRFVERYRRIGGGSPLLLISENIAAKLSDELDRPVYLGMRHWPPFIDDVVKQMMIDGVSRAVVVCMAPHFSGMSIGAYRKALEAAVQAAGNGLEVDFVSSWHTQPDYVCGLVTAAQATLTRFPNDLRARTKVIFTAHSLPVSILERGDPYASQVRETAALVAEALRLPANRWLVAYQSAPKTDAPWLGPALESLVPELGTAGEQALLIVPVGFITDNLEVLYDLDVQISQIAQENGVLLERSPLLNDDVSLVNALANLVRERIHHERGEYES